MAPGLKQPISGLRSIKRDFSSNSLPSASQDSIISESGAAAIPWEPTPPRQKLSGLEQRLKDIQDALSEQSSASTRVLTSSQTLRAGGSQKRPSPSQDPPAKRRQLPPSWEEPEGGQRTSYASTSQGRTFGSARSANGGRALVVPATASADVTGKAGSVQLSQEQLHILKLVQEGQSLFYTGSAGG